MFTVPDDEMLVSTQTYGRRITTEGGTSLTLGLTSLIPIVNSLVNLTGAPVTVQSRGGPVTVAPAPVALTLTYAPQPRIADMVLLPDVNAADTPSSVLSLEQACNALLSADETGVVTLPDPPPTNSSSVHVFVPPVATGFGHPLPHFDLLATVGVLVTPEVGAYLSLPSTVSPYAATADDDDNDEDEEKHPVAREVLPRQRVPVYGANSAARDAATCLATSLVRYPRGL